MSLHLGIERLIQYYFDGKCGVGILWSENKLKDILCGYTNVSIVFAGTAIIRSLTMPALS